MQITNKLPPLPAPALLSPFFDFIQEPFEGCGQCCGGEMPSGRRRGGRHAGSPQAGGCSPPQPVPGLLHARPRCCSPGGPRPRGRAQLTPGSLSPCTEAGPACPCPASLPGQFLPAQGALPARHDRSRCRGMSRPHTPYPRILPGTWSGDAASMAPARSLDPRLEL